MKKWSTDELTKILNKGHVQIAGERVVLQATAPIQKYKNIKTTVDGVTFDSKKEAQRYLALKKMKDEGLIRDLELQPAFECVVNGKKVCKYLADFAYWNVPNECKVVEDVKSRGTITPIYRVKKKLVEAIFGLEIQEVF
jgi:hypothetical protein